MATTAKKRKTSGIPLTGAGKTGVDLLLHVADTAGKLPVAATNVINEPVAPPGQSPDATSKTLFNAFGHENIVVVTRPRSRRGFGGADKIMFGFSGGCHGI